MFCPNCSADLYSESAHCWNCDAVFNEYSSWRPTDQPTGLFRQFNKRTINRERLAIDTAPASAVDRIFTLSDEVGFWTSVGLHALIFLANGVALMHWMAPGFHKPMVALWFITLPFILAFSAIPYVCMVVFPSCYRMKVTIAFGSIFSLLAVFCFLNMGTPRSLSEAVRLVGIAAQLSLIPCIVFALLRRGLRKFKKSA